MKFGTDDYVREMTPGAKFHLNLSTGASRQMGEIGTQILFIYTYFQKLAYRLDHSANFRARWLKRRGLTQGCVFSGVRKILN